ncbi:hypothetical protein D3C83_127150 [compost metagenome]
MKPALRRLAGRDGGNLRLRKWDVGFQHKIRNLIAMSIRHHFIPSQRSRRVLVVPAARELAKEIGG